VSDGTNFLLESVVFVRVAGCCLGAFEWRFSPFFIFVRWGLLRLFVLVLSFGASVPFSVFDHTVFLNSLCTFVNPL